MNICHVIPDLSPSTGGPVTALRGLALAQARQGNTVNVVSTDYGQAPCTYPYNQFNPCYSLSGPSYSGWRYCHSLSHSLDSCIAGADIVHIHTIWQYPTLLAAHISRKHNKPFLLRPCGMLDKWSLTQRRLKKVSYLRLFSDLLFPSTSMLHFTSPQELSNSHYPAHVRTVVIPNGISSEFLDSSSETTFLDSFPTLNGKRIILYLGRLHPKKCPEIAIKAFSRIALSFPDVMLAMVGPGNPSYLSTLKRLSCILCLEDRILFTGLLQGPLLASAYSCAYLFILPSLQENFSNSVLEAMASSCPVVVSPHVALSTLVAATSAGFVSQLDPASFACSISKLLTDPCLASAMGSSGQRAVAHAFTWRAVAEQLSATYSDLLAST